MLVKYPLSNKWGSAGNTQEVEDTERYHSGSRRHLSVAMNSWLGIAPFTIETSNIQIIRGISI